MKKFVLNILHSFISIFDIFGGNVRLDFFRDDEEAIRDDWEKVIGKW